MQNVSTQAEFKKITRRAPELWQEVFHNIVRQRPNSESFKLNDVAYLVRRDKLISITHESLRVKLARYSAKGYLRKIGRAEYIITSRGHMFFDLIKDRSQEWILHKKGVNTKGTDAKCKIWVNLTQQITISSILHFNQIYFERKCHEHTNSHTHRIHNSFRK